MSAPPTTQTVRLDVWLWRARFFKTRSLAARFVADGRVRLARGGDVRRVDKPAQPIAPGDVIVFARAGRAVAVTVRAPGVRRGPPAEARALFEEKPYGASVDGPGAAGHVEPDNPGPDNPGEEP